jgi:polar amino acid transport system substrate-binding protein
LDSPQLALRLSPPSGRAGRGARARAAGARLAALAWLGCGGGDAPPGAIDIATDATFPPFESVDEQSKDLIGFDIDLIRATAERAKLQINLVNSGFDALLAGIGSCQYDAAISSITITPERRSSMLFSEPYFQASQRIVVRSDDTRIAGRADLAGKTVGSQIGTTGALEVGKIAGAVLKTYDEFNQAFQDLLNGQIDAVIADNVIADNVPALGYVAQHPERLRATDDLFGSELYGIAICNQQPELQQKLNAALAELRADGTLAELQARWGLDAAPLPEPGAGGAGTGEAGEALAPR